MTKTSSCVLLAVFLLLLCGSCFDLGLQWSAPPSLSGAGSWGPALGLLMPLVGLVVVLSDLLRVDGILARPEPSRAERVAWMRLWAGVACLLVTAFPVWHLVAGHGLDWREAMFLLFLPLLAAYWLLRRVTQDFVFTGGPPDHTSYRRVKGRVQ